MESLYRCGHLFLLILWMFSYRTTWSFERKGEYLACINQSSLSKTSSISLRLDILTATQCIEICMAWGLQFAAVFPENPAGSCLCPRGESSFFTDAAVPFYRCNATCPGDPQDLCGGPGLTSVYKTSNRTCEDPGMPVNGSRIGDELVLGSTVTFTCSPGLVADGPTVSQCWWVDNITLDIAWSSTSPACVDPPPFTTTERGASQRATEIQIPGMAMTTFQPSSIKMGVIVGSLGVVVFLIIVVFIIAMVLIHKRRQKRRAEFPSKPSQSSLPLNIPKAKIKETSPKEKRGEEEELDIDNDYLVPDASFVSSANKDVGKGLTLQLVDQRPRMPAPPSIKVSLTPEESFYQNSISIALSRSNENVNKESKITPKEIGSRDPGDQTRTISPLHDRSPATKGNVRKAVITKTPSLPLTADEIYENTQVGAKPNSPRMPPSPVIDDRRMSRDSSRPASQLSSLNYRDSVDYITPNEVNQEEMYENARVMTQRQGPRRPPGQPGQPGLKTNVALDPTDCDGVYLDIM